MSSKDEVVDSPVEEAADAPDAAEEVAAPPIEVVRTSPKVAAPKNEFVLEGLASIAAVKFESYARNSASVKLVQERLMQLGFMSAGADEPGWLSTGTREALASFCGCGDKSTCSKDKNTLIYDLFKGTKVTVSP